MTTVTLQQIPGPVGSCVFARNRCERRSSGERLHLEETPLQHPERFRTVFESASEQPAPKQLNSEREIENQQEYGKTEYGSVWFQKTVRQVI